VYNFPQKIKMRKNIKLCVIKLLDGCFVEDCNRLENLQLEMLIKPFGLPIFCIGIVPLQKQRTNRKLMFMYKIKLSK